MELKSQLLRKASGTTGLDTTLRRAVKALAAFGIPHYVCGGFAVQEHGYARMTIDVDIIVPNVADAMFRLQRAGFKQNQGSNMTLTDPKTHVEIDLMPGGGSVGPGPISLPMPTRVSEEPVILSLEELLSIKLSSYVGSGVKRMKDAADVVELIKINSLPRNYPMGSAVKDTYQNLWDGLQN